MKIVSWNCNGAFRKKCPILQELNADIYIIQECENPNSITSKNDDFSQLSLNFLWQGENKNKGVGVFARSGITIERLEFNHNWRDRSLKWFLPFEVTTGASKVRILGTWSHGADAKAFAYIGQSWLFLDNNRGLFNNLIVAGDFNSNVIWDSWDRWWNHSDYVRELDKIGTTSVYHHLNSEKQGEESSKTFYLQRNENKKYHIDYIFSPLEYINRTTNFKIHDFEKWKQFSDHVPLEWDIDLTKFST